MRSGVLSVTAFALAISGCAKEPADEGSVDTTLGEPSERAQPSEAATEDTQADEKSNSSRRAKAEAEAAAQRAWEESGWHTEDNAEYAPTPLPTPRGAIPRGNPGSWATTNDYPSRALREERGGTVSFRVVVDESGRVADCIITGSSGQADLDQATCDNIRRRARFSPAIGDDGQPTMGSYSNRVRWTIPSDIFPY